MRQGELASRRHSFTSFEEVQEFFHRERLTDGLPVVPPTEEQVRRMLADLEMEPSEVVAVEGLRGKEFTAEKVAINAVMVGCRPEYMPVVVAAVKAMAERPFNLHGVANTTGGMAVLVVVSGPIARELGINAGTNLFGHGHRANATIGRAITLMVINIYGSFPDEMDKSTFGHPGKYTYCIAENEEASPWEPLRVEKGFSRDTSTVTVFGAEGPRQVSNNYSRDPEVFLASVADTMLGLGPEEDEMVVVLSGQLLDHLGEAGWSKERAREYLARKASRTARRWASWGRLQDPSRGGDENRLVSVCRDPELLTLLGGGGPGQGHAAVIPVWTGSRSVTKEIRR